MHRGMPTMGLIGRAGPARTRKGGRGGGTLDRNISTEIVLPIAQVLPVRRPKFANNQFITIVYDTMTICPTSVFFVHSCYSFRKNWAISQQKWAVEPTALGIF
jgi:hypothetical protein